MRNRIHQRPQVKHDLLEQADYLSEHAGIEVTERFLDSARETLTFLAESPDVGSPCLLDHPQLADLRHWRVKEFPNHVIFYRCVPGGIDVIRLLHSARDWQTILGSE